jgi:nucleoside-diphosphate-sugar epimerase
MTSTLSEARASYVAHELNRDLPLNFQHEIRSELLRVAELQAKLGRSERRVLLIGAAGYVGSVMTQHLLECGYAVSCLDLLLYRNDVCVLPYTGMSRYAFHYGDLSDVEAVGRALHGVTDVVILGGLVGDPITKKYPAESDAINRHGVGRLFELLAGRGLNRVVFVSTCSNYGLIKSDQTATEDHELQPLSRYAEAKVENERRLLSSVDERDYDATVLRFATAFGLSPRMRFDLTVNEFTRELYVNKSLSVYDAHTWRPYCHTRDFALAVRRVLEAPQGRVRGQVFNVGSDENNCTKKMVVDKLLAHLPEGGAVQYKGQGSDPRNYRVSFERIRERLLFTASRSVDDGIRELLSALREHLFDRVEQNRPFYGNYEVSYQVRDRS